MNRAIEALKAMLPYGFAVASLLVLLGPGAAFAQTEIGVVKGFQRCAGDEVHFTLDSEDSNNKNGLKDPDKLWVGGYPSDKHYIHLVFCRTDGDAFFKNSGRGTFAVLQLSNQCPAGTLSFERQFDDEDHNNHSKITSSRRLSVAPNMKTNAGNTFMNFCLYSSESGGDFGFLDLGYEYGVFGTPESLPQATAFGILHSDDEDSRTGQQKDRMYYSWTIDPYDIDAQRARALIAPEGENKSCNGVRLECWSNNPVLGFITCAGLGVGCSCSLKPHCTTDDGVHGRNTDLHFARVRP